MEYINKKYDVACVGIATWDTLLTGIDNNLMNKDSAIATSFFATSGGDCVNGAINLSRLGLNVCIVANIGDDTSGKLIINELEKANVDTKYLHIDKDSNTASPILIVDEKGDRHIIRIPNSANHHFCLEMIDMESLDNSKHLHFASANVLPMMDGESLGKLFKIAHDKGLTTSLDASYAKDNNHISIISEALYNCDIFIPSLQEASEYAGSENVKDIIDFFSKYPIKVFGIKLGEKGAIITDFKEEYEIPTLFEGKVVDTTGAGDAFIAGFVNGYIRGYDIASCAYLGSAQSASVLSSIGANTSAGTFNEALELIDRKKIILHKKY